MTICQRCRGCRWVCEDHPELPWEGDHACGCGAAGMPCPVCNTTDPPEMSPDFKVDIDVDKGWRH